MNILRFPAETDGHEQAATWIVRLERGLQSSEREHLQRWLAQSRHHRAMLLELAATWDKSALLSEIAPLFPRPGTERPFRSWRPAAAAIMSLAVVLAAGIAWRGWPTGPAIGSSPSEATARVLADTVFSSAFGQRRRIALPDGSTLTLNTDSRVRVQITARSRELELLRGQALFEVARDPSRVFGVTVGASRFEALGTAFDLRLDPGVGVQLSVTEGRVRVLVAAPTARSSAADSELTVAAGESVMVADRINGIEPLEKVQPAAVTAWTHGMIVFDAVPLGDAVREIGRYSRLRFRIENNEISQLPVSGYFKTGDTEALIESLKNNFDVESRRDGEDIYLWKADSH